jgi:hypothetical protein
MTIKHKQHTHAEITQLKHELPVHCAIRTERGAPRLFLNNRETYPLVAWSWGLEHSAPYFKQAGINMLQPVLGLNAAWENPTTFDFSEYDTVFATLLRQNSNAYFLPRILLDVPDWWKDKHPNELVQVARPFPKDRPAFRPIRRNSEGGWLWGLQTREPSIASTIWRQDMTTLLTALLQHIKNSPLASRVIGYQIGAGIYGEWHYFISPYVPDFSEPVRQKIGHIPDLKTRNHTTFGLLRDPAQEQDTITYFQRFHQDICADALLHFAQVAKQETDNQVIIGAFYGYLLENVWIQDGGHLAPEKVLSSPHIDFFASPYTYQRTNIPGRHPWEHDIVDGANNNLGRARGVAGDGGYRILWESLKRHNKLYFVELDSNTYLEPPPINPDGTGGTDVENELCMLGGEGTTTKEGTFRILSRDLGQVFVRGNGGWLFDFGPVLRLKTSWYADADLTNFVQKFVQLGEKRATLDLSSIAQIAAVYDAKSLFTTRYWAAEEKSMDFFSTWYLDSQSRSLHRLGAPVDSLYRFDLKPSDATQYKLFLMVNTFYLTTQDIDHLHNIFHNSGATVVWYYAPGFISPNKLDLEHMQHLTGFQFKIHTEPGPLLIHADLPSKEGGKITFGINDTRSPRFSPQNGDILGHWTDNKEPALTRLQTHGYTSIYAGTAPLPQKVLRWLTHQSGAHLWSDQPDIVMASQDTAMLVATSQGKRTLTLPHPLTSLSTHQKESTHTHHLAYGDVELYTK